MEIPELLFLVCSFIFLVTKMAVAAVSMKSTFHVCVCLCVLSGV